MNRCYLPALLLLPCLAQAHFQELIPSVPLLDAASGTQLRLDLRFTHPQENGPVMAMAKPARMAVVVEGGEQPLDDKLVADKCQGQPCYHLDYRVPGPGTYRFLVEPAPYWEPAEGKWITHYTQVVVDAFDAGSGWDAPLGLPVEILPLTRPFALWRGATFSGVVLQDGEPVPFAPIEAEWRNSDGLSLPGGPYTTFELRADANGTFHFSAPRAGWWGLAALVDGEARPGPDGEPAAVELGGLLWLYFREME